MVTKRKPYIVPTAYIISNNGGKMSKLKDEIENYEKEFEDPTE